MSLVVSSLTAYVNGASQDLLTKAVIEADSLKYFEIMPGIKYSDRLLILDTDVPMQAGGCGWISSGNTTLTQKDITVTSLRRMEAICPDTLEKYQLQLSMKAGKPSAIPFEQLYADMVVKRVNEKIENMIWANNVGTTTNFAGMIFQLTGDTDANSTVQNFDWSVTTGLTSTSYINQIFKQYVALPAEIRSDPNLYLYIGHDALARVIQSFIVANLYHIGGADVDLNTLSGMLVGIANLTIVGVNGLNGSAYGVMTPSWNFVFGTDLVSEEDKLEAWYSQDNQEVRTVVNFKAAVAYKFGTYVVYSR